MLDMKKTYLCSTVLRGISDDKCTYLSRRDSPRYGNCITAFCPKEFSEVVSNVLGWSTITFTS